MRTDPANWKLGVAYYCPDDPRVVVRQRLPVGWAWNFAHPRVLPAILLAILVFLAPAVVAWWLGARSPLILLVSLGVGLGAVMLGAHYASREPSE